MYYKEHVRDNNKQFDFGSFSKETEFGTVDIEKISQLNLKARVAYTVRVIF